MTGYTKLFGSIVASTIWREPHTVRIVWITMLAMANKDGVVEASMPGLADLSRVSIDECKAAISALASPDEYSRTPEYEGRRIEQVEGGWRILNHAKYRAKMGADERREYLRVKQAEWRSKKKLSTDVNSRSDSSTQSTHTKADTKAEADTESKEVPTTLPSASPTRGIVEGKNSDRIPTSEQSKRIAGIFHRRLSTAWTDDEVKAYKKIGTIPEDELVAVEKYYAANWPPMTGVNILRHDIRTFLNNFSGEVDRAKHVMAGKNGHSKPEVEKSEWKQWLKTQNQAFVPYEHAQPFMRDDFQKFLKTR